MKSAFGHQINENPWTAEPGALTRDDDPFGTDLPQTYRTHGVDLIGDLYAALEAYERRETVGDDDVDR